MIILGTNSIKDTGFDVANSCNFEDGSLHKAISSPSTTYTISAWFKLSNSDVATSSAGNIYLWTGGTGGGGSGGYWNSSNTQVLKFYNEGVGHVDDGTSRKYRDPSAWYNWVWKCASGTGTLYVNGVQSGSTFTMGAINNYGDFINVGRYSNGTDYAQVTMAEFVYLDGTAATPTSFGEYDEDSPTIWKPIDVSGLTFGTNGFHLDFEDSANLGNDANGGTDLTKTGTLVQHTDSPTNNFATLNPLNSTGNGTEPTYSEGNLQSASPSSSGGFVGSSTIGVTNGKWFWEFKKSGGSATNIYNGIGNEVGTAEIARQSSVGIYFGNQVFYRPDGTKQIITNGSNANSSYGASWTTNDIIGIALDLDSGTNTVTFYKNGASQGSINLPVNTDTWFFIVACGTDTVDTWQLNFGNPAFTISSGNTDGNGYGNFEYAVPSGYYSLCTKNLAEYG